MPGHTGSSRPPVRPRVAVYDAGTEALCHDGRAISALFIHEPTAFDVDHHDEHEATHHAARSIWAAAAAAAGDHCRVAVPQRPRRAPGSRGLPVHGRLPPAVQPRRAVLPLLPDQLRCRHRRRAGGSPTPCTLSSTGYSDGVISFNPDWTRFVSDLVGTVVANTQVCPVSRQPRLCAHPPGHACF